MKASIAFIYLLCRACEAIQTHYMVEARLDEIRTEPLQIPGTYVSDRVVVQGRVYLLKYIQELKIINLSVSGRNFGLQRMPQKRDVKLIGADAIIGFLPDELQLYKEAGILVYASAIRTSSGNGEGQCGSGAEVFLNFLDTMRNRPSVMSSILIGSCDRSIELDDQDISTGRLGNISKKDGKLHLHFLNYEKLEGSPTAVVASDLKKLIFR
jgi:hypothetical protein